MASWKDHAEPVRDEAICWHRLWVDNGRPSNGYVADIRQSTCYKYKQIVKQLKQNQNDIISNKMAQSLQVSNKRPFWNEVKQINRKAVSVDAVNGFDKIHNLF